MNNPLPRLPEFEYVRLDTLEQTTQFLKTHPGEAYPFLGGTDLLVGMRDRRKHPKYLVDLKHLDGLNTRQFDPSFGLTIGASTTLNQLIGDKDVQAHYPILCQAAKQVGGYQLRNRATLVGNISTASPCGDPIGPSLVYHGQAYIIGPTGERYLPLEDFFLGPGKVALEEGEIVHSITLPPPPAQNKGVYLCHGRNNLSDLAIAAVTVLAFPDDSASSGYRFRITLSAVSPTVIAVEEAQELLSGEIIETAAFEKSAQVAKEVCKPIDDIRSSSDYRRELIYALTLRALIQTWEALQAG